MGRVRGGVLISRRATWIPSASAQRQSGLWTSQLQQPQEWSGSLGNETQKGPAPQHWGAEGLQQGQQLRQPADVHLRGASLFTGHGRRQ